MKGIEIMNIRQLSLLLYRFHETRTWTTGQNVPREHQEVHKQCTENRLLSKEEPAVVTLNLKPVNQAIRTLKILRLWTGHSVI